MKLFLVIAAVFFPIQAFAYFDPGTGSMLIQIVIGAIATIAVFWRKIKTAIVSWFGRKKAEEDRENDTR